MLYIGYLINSFRQFLWDIQALAYLCSGDKILVEKHKYDHEETKNLRQQLTWPSLMSWKNVKMIVAPN